MPSYPRNQIVFDDQPGIYHCCTQIVQQQWLFGYDWQTGRDFSYRKTWVEDGLRRLARFMAIEFLDFAVMDNHLHVMVHTRPDVVSGMSDREVAIRWCYLCRSAGMSREERRKVKRWPPRPTEKQVRALLGDDEKLTECRRRLSSISWMMRLLCQPIARRANQEAGTRGRFFASRFKSQLIEDEASLLVCSMYVNMNPVRAGIVKDLEDAVHTSGYLRVLAKLRSEDSGDLRWASVDSETTASDTWLAPVFLDPRAVAYQSVDDLQLVAVVYSSELSGEDAGEFAVSGDEDHVVDSDCSAVNIGRVSWDRTEDPRRNVCAIEERPAAIVPGPVFQGDQLVAEVFGPRLTDRGYLPLSLEEFIEMAKWTAAKYRHEDLGGDSGGAVLLDKLGLNPETWAETVASVGKAFSTSIGTITSLDRRAKDRGRSWIKGRCPARRAFKAG